MRRLDEIIRDFAYLRHKAGRRMITSADSKEDIKQPLNFFSRTESEYFARCSQAIYRFPNGYGCSVLSMVSNFRLSDMQSMQEFKFFKPYISNEDEFELAVVHFPNEENVFDIVYDTHLTDDVLGHIAIDEVLRVMKLVFDLPLRKQENKNE